MLPKLRDVHVNNLRNHGYDSLKEWTANPNHLYIGRRNLFVEGAEQSKYHNPYTVKKYGLEQALRLYYEDWKDKDLTELLKYKEIGCWCCDYDDIPKTLEACKCHGQVLLLILSKQILN